MLKIGIDIFLGGYHNFVFHYFKSHLDDPYVLNGDEYEREHLLYIFDINLNSKFGNPLEQGINSNILPM